MPRNSTTYKISGTSTLRLASSKILGKYGSNLQNVEKSMRKIYIPDEGKIFIQCDQSGAEALIVAYLCRDGSFRKLFTNGVKPHVYVAIHLFKDAWQKELNKMKGDIRCSIDEIVNTPIELLKKNPFWKDLDRIIKSSDNWPASQRYYYLAKQTCHSSNYDIKANTFQLNVLEKSGGKIVLTKQQAEHFLIVYHTLFPELREWHRKVREQVESTGYVYNLFGFPLYCGHYNKTENFWKECYARVPQSTVGTITNIAFIKLQNFIELNKLDWDVIQNNHDSYLTQCPIKEELECAKIMKAFIEQDLVSPDGIPFKMKSEVQSGYNWSPANEKYNPDGLKEILI